MEAGNNFRYGEILTDMAEGRPKVFTVTPGALCSMGGVSFRPMPVTRRRVALFGMDS
ncbi:hypothetical protein EDD55_10512 [Varunaivibrio sulfuroxidans]|uniref:Uncharacterized protein n=1 Tax=Varunaivibrio sulfuroxidans TaxID=1773489 RepID=A0A4R3JAA0_9PROT|nr:hypothetical protein EDD55_10512 [Varunaivibrio sulfuroxidans]